MKKQKMLKVLSAVALTSALTVTYTTNSVTHNLVQAAETSSKSYALPVKMMHFYENRTSMGNAALVDATVTKVGNIYQYTVTLQDMTFLGQTDGLSKLWVEGKEIPLTKINRAGLTNPVQATFTSTTLKDNFDIEIFVNAMEKISEGSGQQKAKLIFDTSKVPAEINDVVTETTETESIDFKVVEKQVDSIEKGVRNRVRAGVKGEKTITYKVTTKADGTVTKEKISENITKQPVDEIVLVGTKEKTETPVENADSLPATLDLIPNKVDEQYTVPAYLATAKDNSKKSAYNGAFIQSVNVKKAEGRYYYTFKLQPASAMGMSYTLVTPKTNGELITLVKDPETNIQTGVIVSDKKLDKINFSAANSAYPMVHETPIILDWSKAEKVKNETVTETTETESIDFKVVEKKLDTMDKGVRRTVRAGVKGEKTITYKVTTKADGTVTKEKISENITKQPVDEIVLVGTKEKTETPVENADSFPATLDLIPANVAEQYSVPAYLANAKDNSKKSAYNSAFIQSIDVKVADGKYYYTFKLQPANAMGMSYTLVTPKTNGKLITLTKDSNDNIETGVIVSDKKLDKINFSAANSAYPMTHDAPIILDWSKAEKFNMNIITETENIAVKTKRVADDSMFAGEEKVETEGRNGEKSITYKVISTADGAIISKEKVSEKVTTEPIAKVVKYGTKTKQTPNNTNLSKPGVFVDTKLVKFYEPSSLSMGNAAIVGTRVYEENGTYHYILTMQDLKFMGQTDGISKFWVNGVEQTVTPINKAGLLNPVEVHFTSKEKLTSVDVDVFVQTMENISAGAGRQKAKLVFNWSNTKPIEKDQELTPKPSTPQIENPIVTNPTITETPTTTPTTVDNTVKEDLSTTKDGWLVGTKLMHYYQAGKESMGNKAIVDTFVYEENGVYHYIVTLQDINFLGQTDGISRFWVNGVETPIYKINRPGLINPVQVHFTANSKLSSIDVDVFVNAMEQIQAGGGRQKAKLVFDWSNAQNTTRDVSATNGSNRTLAKTGTTPTETASLGILAIIGAFFLRRKKQK